MINQIYSSAFVAETLSQDYVYFAGFAVFVLIIGLVSVVKRRKRIEANAVVDLLDAEPRKPTTAGDIDLSAVSMINSDGSLAGDDATNPLNFNESSKVVSASVCLTKSALDHTKKSDWPSGRYVASKPHSVNSNVTMFFFDTVDGITKGMPYASLASGESAISDAGSEKVSNRIKPGDTVALVASYLYDGGINLQLTEKLRTNVVYVIVKGVG